MALFADVLNDHVHVHARQAELREEDGSHSRPVRDAPHSDLGLVLTIGDSADDELFHGFVFLHDDGPFLFIECRPHMDLDAEVFRELHRPGVQDLGAGARHFKHFVVADGRKLFRFLHDMGVGRENPVDVLVKFADIRLQGRRDGHRGQIAPAPAQGGDFLVLGLPLEPSHDDHLALGQGLADLGVAHPHDARLGVHVVGHDAHLGPRKGNGVAAAALDGHGQQGDGLLFASGQKNVHFPLVGHVRDLLGQGNEIIGRIPGRRNDDDHLVAFSPGLDDSPRNLQHFGSVRHG